MEGKGLDKYEGQALEFIQEAEDRQCLPNMVMVIDTHTDSNSGLLQMGGGLTGKVRTGDTEDLLRGYVGSEVMKRMRRISMKARSDKTKEHLAGGKVKSSISSRVRGGWRVLILATCGPAVTKEDSLNYLLNLVRE
jgi:hypothetical protein